MAQSLSRQWGWKAEAVPPCPTCRATCPSELTYWVCNDGAGKVNEAEPEALINSVGVRETSPVPISSIQVHLLMRHGRANGLCLGSELPWHTLILVLPTPASYPISPDPFCSGSSSSCGLAFTCLIISALKSALALPLSGFFTLGSHLSKPLSSPVK